MKDSWIGPRLLALLCAFSPMVAGAAEAYVATASLESPLATQAAAADGEFVYAIASASIAKLERGSGREVARSSGEAKHLNSGVFHAGKIYCAHSNFPLKPEEGDIRELDPATMKLEVFHRFASPPGSVTWALPDGDGGWWCHFARYGRENGKAVLVRYDPAWKESGRWTFPAALIGDLGASSLSGGIWSGGSLLVTGHDKKVIYRLKLPEKGSEMELVEQFSSPFPGQGIAVDPVTGGLVGIDRAKRRIIFASMRRTGE